MSGEKIAVDGVTTSQEKALLPENNLYRKTNTGYNPCTRTHGIEIKMKERKDKIIPQRGLPVLYNKFQYPSEIKRVKKV